MPVVVDVLKVMREVPVWAVLCGVLDATMMLMQFVAVMYLPVVITMCIKRAGIVLTVLAGWLFFKEKDIADRLIAACSMVGGIVLFYLPLRASQAFAITAAVAVALGLALYFTRSARQNMVSTVAILK
jgi:drug/metabolite transporter (DMT)-like permease